MSETASEEAFRLSRIRAIGWNAGQHLTAEDADTLNETIVAKMNPYSIDSERERWSEGFMDAITKSAPRRKEHPMWGKG